MKSLTICIWLALLLGGGTAHAQKTKIFQTRITHYDNSSTKGILYDVGPQGLIMLDAKTVSALSKKDVRSALLNNQLPTFVVPFQEIREISVRRWGAAGKGFGLGYLASFITLETVMAANALSSPKMGCDGVRRKPSLGSALIGASCAAPPGIVGIAAVSFAGGGLGSLVSAISQKYLSLDPRQPEVDAREKLGRYALAPQK